MKRSASILTKITFGLAIAAGVTACKQTPTETKSTAAVPVDGKATIVYVNQDSLTAQYKGAIDMRKRLEEKDNSARAAVQAKQQAFQRSYVDAQKRAATMTPDQQKSEGERLQKEQAALQQFQQNAGAEVQNASSEELKKLYDKIVEFTKAYAKEKGYKMVLTYQNGNTTMLYGDPSLDVTADVIKRLNDAYEKK
ncbi:OmpH family outer membrane protein [Mucilaginibacter mali]|uniref:OmpH family outer membrane protein n=1 Tax=Mucilaginibacter mali TaxID=2740462 RepID=A0A7D4QM11_9SPHI|nr:OmpH family outer membrane protein [Mucilaginibacter mali]QKJ31450.1 OmpH family outer membrane protein [Mucilaginibacter mali]